MYDYRRWTPEERAQVVSERIQRGYPQHGPPHIDVADCFRIITGACFEHTSMLAMSDRMEWFETQLLEHIRGQQIECTAWVVLPNHYHVLVRLHDVKAFAKKQGMLHGRTAFELNRRDNMRGRRVWYRCQDRCIRSERHYFTTLNYIHNNPVKHGYVKKWGEWPFSSFHWYLLTKGRDWLEEIWREHPVLNYGDKWDV